MSVKFKEQTETITQKITDTASNLASGKENFIAGKDSLAHEVGEALTKGGGGVNGYLMVRTASVTV